MSKLISDYPVSHGWIRPREHPVLHVPVTSETAVRYCRFLRPVKLDHLQIGRIVWGRWIPSVPVHPAHIRVSVLERDTGRWQDVTEVDLPYEPQLAGEGLSQEDNHEKAEAFFKRILESPGPKIPLKGIETDHLRIECDSEHPVWPSHGECNGGLLNVPFGTLREVASYGTCKQEPPRATYQSVLKATKIRPKAPAGMRVRDLPHMILYESDRFSIGFSLRRPMLMHLGWDAEKGRQVTVNRLLSRCMWAEESDYTAPIGFSGPCFRTLQGDYGAQRWTGEVQIEDNRVMYRRLRAMDGIEIDATFIVDAEGFTQELTQRASCPVPVLEAEAWRLAWDAKQALTGAVALPTLRPGRNGEVAWPVIWAGEGVGCLRGKLIKSDLDAHYQIESYRCASAVTGGIVLAPRPAPDHCLVIPPGEQQSTARFEVGTILPTVQQDDPRLSEGLRRHWSTLFACFRPEFRGFSNNAVSTNCHVNQHVHVEITAHTRREDLGFDPLEISKFTLQRALLDGGGYGYHRNLYLDSDPALISAAGQIYRYSGDEDWLERVGSGISTAVERILATVGEDGLALCRDLSGNSGSHRWSSNAMDVVGFGHLDAYVNAWTFRALKNAHVLLQALANHRLAERCSSAAQGLRAAYSKIFINPDTGWVIGWRSRDGQIHDAAFIWVNGPAIAFGLLDPPEARNALEQLEAEREKVGISDARLGLPGNLRPLAPADHMLPILKGPLKPTFELYTDGGLSPIHAAYYLRALSIYGFKDEARRLADDLESGYLAGLVTGPNGTGREFLSWDSVPTGYEGTLINSLLPMYGIAVVRGVITPPEPEWWPK